MSVDRRPSPVSVVERAYACLRRGDLDEWIEMWADDVEFRQTDAVPWGGVYRGKSECLTFLERARAQIESAAGPTESLYACGEDVVAIGRSRGRAIETGRDFDIRIVHVWRVRGDRIAGWTLYVDTDGLRQALGINGGRPADHREGR